MAVSSKTHVTPKFQLNIEETETKSRVNLKLKGTIEKEDYKKIGPSIDKALDSQNKSIHGLFDLREFKGLHPNAIWSEIKLSAKSMFKFDRIAIVGDKKWMESSTKLGDLLTPGKIEYFTSLEEAKNWFSKEPEPEPEKYEPVTPY